MARESRPWFWEKRQEWYVTIEGTRHRLGPDEDEAKRKFHEIKSRPSQVVSSDTVVAIIQLFLDWTQKHRESSTFDWYKKHLGSFQDSLTPQTLTVDKLKAYHVDSWVDEHTWGDSYRRGAMAAVARCLSWAERKGHIDRNPIHRKLDMPAYGKRERYIEPHEWAEIQKHLKSNFRDVVMIAWETGARPQEICKVEARHVELQNGRWRFKVKESKGKKKERIVYLSDLALEITKRLMAEHPEGPLFLTAHGNPWDRHRISDAFTRLKEKVGVKYRLYDFRFSFCTNGLKKGVDPVTMQHLMGHTDLQMISKIYALVNQDVNHMREMAMKAVK